MVPFKCVEWKPLDYNFIEILLFYDSAQWIFHVRCVNQRSHVYVNVKSLLKKKTNRKKTIKISCISCISQWPIYKWGIVKKCRTSHLLFLDARVIRRFTRNHIFRHVGLIYDPDLDTRKSRPTNLFNIASTFSRLWFQILTSESKTNSQDHEISLNDTRTAGGVYSHCA